MIVFDQPESPSTIALFRASSIAEIRKHGVSVLDVTGFPIESNWHVVRQKGKRLSPIAQVFQEHLLVQSGKWARPDT